MKYIIKKIEYITGDTRRCEKVTTEVDNIEAYRKELYKREKCDTIYFTYETIE